MKFKKILPIIVVFLFLVSIPLAVYLVKQRQEIRMRAAPASTLSFVPSSLTTSPGQTFTLEVLLETATNIVPTVELHITFDPAVFEATSLVAGPALSNVFDGPRIDNNLGTAFIVVGDVNDPVEGSATIASISFRVIGSSEEGERIEFASQTQAGAWGEEGVNVLIGTNPALITVFAEVVEATPTPTAAIEATPTPTSTLSGIGGGLMLTPTPTSATASPTPTPTVPVTGVVMPTWLFLGAGLLLLMMGAFAFL